MPRLDDLVHIICDEGEQRSEDLHGRVVIERFRRQAAVGRQLQDPLEGVVPPGSKDDLPSRFFVLEHAVFRGLVGLPDGLDLEKDRLLRQTWTTITINRRRAVDSVDAPREEVSLLFLLDAVALMQLTGAPLIDCLEQRRGFDSLLHKVSRVPPAGVDLDVALGDGFVLLGREEADAASVVLVVASRHCLAELCDDRAARLRF